MAHPVPRADIGHDEQPKVPTKSGMYGKKGNTLSTLFYGPTGWWDYDSSVLCDKHCALYQGFSVGLLQRLCFARDAFPLVLVVTICGLLAFVRLIAGIYMLGKVLEGCSRLAGLCVAKGTTGIVCWGIVLVCIACTCKDNLGYDVITRNVTSRIIFSLFALASLTTYILEIALIAHDVCPSDGFSRLMQAFVGMDTILLVLALTPCLYLRCKQNKRLMERKNMTSR